MKTIQRVAALILMSFLSLIAFAQDKKVDVNINTKSDDSNFWGSPVVWVVGAAVFILLLVALLRGNRKEA